MSYRIFLLIACLLLNTQSAVADDYDVRTYNRDMEMLRAELFDPLKERFSSNNDVHWRDYLKAMLDRASELQDQMNPLTYGMMRDAALTMAMNFTEYKQDGKWSDAAYHMNNVLDLIGRIMSYREAAD